MFAIDMSPHPGDTLETVFTVENNVMISQAVSAPADVLYFDQVNIYNANEICLSANEEITGTTNDIFNSGLTADIAVAYIGFEMEIIESGHKMLIVANIDESRGGYLHFASHYQQGIFFS